MEPRLISPSDLRARIATLDRIKEQLREDLQRAEPHRRDALERALNLVRSGYFPDGFDPDEQILLTQMNRSFPGGPLSTAELLTYNTFFELHPHRIAGVLMPSTARDFPLTVRGTRSEVEAAIDTTLQQSPLERDALQLEAFIHLFDL